MTRVGDVTAAPPAAAAGTADADHPKLRAVARQLTGLFAQQLFKAMRETVPQDEGVVSGGSGEEMFTGMLDEHLAGADAAAKGDHGGAGSAGAAFTRDLADAVYRRLRLHAAPEPTAAPAADTPPGASPVTQPSAPASLGQPLR